jgi:hypothetical protein
MFSKRVRPPALAEILGLVQRANLRLNLTSPDNTCPYLREFCTDEFWSPDRCPYKMPPEEEKKP